MSGSVSRLEKQFLHASNRKRSLQLKCGYAFDQSGLHLSDAAKRKPALFKVTALQNCTVHTEQKITQSCN
jgi:hypothetical protein